MINERKLSENELISEAKKSNVIIDASDNFDTRFSLELFLENFPYL